MTDNNHIPVKQVEVSLERPDYASVLTEIENSCAEVEAVGVFDLRRESALIQPHAENELDKALALAKDLMDRGAGRARKELLKLASTDFAAWQVDQFWLLLVPFAEGQVVVACMDCHGKLETLPRHAKKIAQKLQSQEMNEALQNHSNVLRGWLLDLETLAITAEFKRRGSEGRAALATIDHLHPLEQILAAAHAFLAAAAPQPRLDWLQGVMLELGGRTQVWQRLAFVPDCVLWLQTDGEGWSANATSSLKRLQDDVLRQLIAELLASGMDTLIEPFPQTDHEFNAIVEELRNLDKTDLVQRLVVGGFADHPIGEGEDRMRCMECIYFLPHRRWCDLPELPVPVEADWFCRLWKM